MKLSQEEVKKLGDMLIQMPELSTEEKRRVFLDRSGLNKIIPHIQISGTTFDAVNNILSYLQYKEDSSFINFLNEIKEFIKDNEKSYIDFLIYKFNSPIKLKSRKEPLNIIRDYLTSLDKELKEKYEYRIQEDAQKNFISLSGLPTRAYEETSYDLKRIENLDEYLTSNKLQLPTIIYGPPGSGKSTTLYKVFQEYKKRILSSKKTLYIPVFIHVNYIHNILKDSENENFDAQISTFLTSVFKNSNQEILDFTNYIKENSAVKLIIIVDALDEFLDKKHRYRLFNILATLIQKTYLKGTKWILSCREKEYAAYRQTLKKIANIQIQPINSSQVEKFLAKRVKNLSLVHEAHNKLIRNTLNKLREINKSGEKSLNNPYYLAIWLDLIANDNSNSDLVIPSIDRLHQRELKREIMKGYNISQEEFNTRNYDIIYNNMISIMSILAYSVLEQSLRGKNTKDIKVITLEFIKRIDENIQTIIKNKNFDELTDRRIEQYKDNLGNNYTEDDYNFIKIMNLITIVLNTNPVASNFTNENQNIFTIVSASIIESGYNGNLFSIENNDFEKMIFTRFINQRAGDYLAARYLREEGLSTVLKNMKIPNFWLSRSIAISLAISKDLGTMLQNLEIPEDHVFESAIVDGLTLFTSAQKDEATDFVNKFIKQLVNNQRLNKENKSDPCASIRLLSEVGRILTINFNSLELNRSTFMILLNQEDLSIYREASIVWLCYLSQNNFNFYEWFFVVKSFCSRALRCEFISIYKYLYPLLKRNLR